MATLFDRNGIRVYWWPWQLVIVTRSSTTVIGIRRNKHIPIEAVWWGEPIEVVWSGEEVIFSDD